MGFSFLGTTPVLTTYSCYLLTYYVISCYIVCLNALFVVIVCCY